MNILFFASRLIYGGGEKVRNWLALQLINSGHEVVYATSHYDSSYKEELKQVSLLNKVKVVEYPFIIKKKNPFKYFKCIESIYRDNKIDLLIYFGGSLVEQLIAKKNGVRIILSERCDPMSRNFLSRILKLAQYKVSDGYVFQTPEAANYYGKKAKQIGVIIPNPIIDELPSPIFNNLRKEIVTVGRLSEEKNQQMLIRAFSKFLQIFPDYKLKIYGNGQLEPFLRSLIKSYGLESTVEIIKGNRNIVNAINGSSLFVLPSNTEGMPNALIEALSVGVLSISTDCPIYGPRMLIKHGYNGFLTPIKDEQCLLNIMIEAFSDEERTDEIRRNAVNIRKILSAPVIAKKWIDYIEQS